MGEEDADLALKGTAASPQDPPHYISLLLDL